MDDFYNCFMIGALFMIAGSLRKEYSAHDFVYSYTGFGFIGAGLAKLIINFSGI